MAIQGTGAVNYRFGTGPVAQAAKCQVQIEGALTLTVEIADPNLGAVRVVIAVTNYSAETKEYEVSLDIETSSGGRKIPGNLFLRSTTLGAATIYSGFFRPAHLNANTIELVSFTLAVSDGIAADNIYWLSGAGVGSMTYIFGANPIQTQHVYLTSTSFFDNGVIYALQMTVNWFDPIQGNCFFWMQVSPFSGTGSYPCSVLLWSQTTSPGNWEAGGTLNAIYSQIGNKSLWQGSIAADNLPWQDGPGQPDVSLDVSALSLTITITQG